MASLQEANIEGITFHPLKKPTHSKLDYLANLVAVKKIVHIVRPQILHAHYATSYGLLGAFTNFHPFIITTWGQDILDFPRGSVLHKKLLEWNLSRADVVTALSRQLVKATNGYLPKGRSTHLTFFGVDMDQFRPIDRPERKEITIGIIKMLEPKYGIECLIRAFSLVQRKIDHLRLLIVGDGSLREKLEKLAGELDVSDRATFVGKIPHSLVPYWLAQMDVFVCSSIHESETFGVVVAEASAMETPVIASRIGGLPEVVQDGITGFLVPPANVEEMADKMERLASDSQLREKMGKAGREFIKQNYEWEKCVREMEAVYGGVLRP